MMNAIWHKASTFWNGVNTIWRVKIYFDNYILAWSKCILTWSICPSFFDLGRIHFDNRVLLYFTVWPGANILFDSIMANTFEHAGKSITSWNKILCYFSCQLLRSVWYPGRSELNQYSSHFVVWWCSIWFFLWACCIVRTCHRALCLDRCSFFFLFPIVYLFIYLFIYF